MLGITENAFTTYVKAVPFQFYSLIAVIMVPTIIIAKADFGPMKTFEQNRAKGIIPEYEKDDMPGDDASEAQSKAKAIMVWLPLTVMLTVMFGLLIPRGFPFDMTNLPSGAFRASLSTGYVFAAAVLILLMARYGVRSLAGGFALYIKSMSNIVGVLAILVLAWSLGAIGKDLEAPAFISGLVDGRLPVFLIPAMVFVVGGIISFATGSSWGTYAILIPLIVPMAHQFDLDMYVAIGAVLSGGLFGDHCSPISDTTILSATGAGCAQLDHVKTQLPYALFNGACSLAAFIVAGLTASVMSLALGIVLMMAGLFIMKRI